MMRAKTLCSVAVALLLPACVNDPTGEDGDVAPEDGDDSGKADGAAAGDYQIAIRPNPGGNPQQGKFIAYYLGGPHGVGEMNVVASSRTYSSRTTRDAVLGGRGLSIRNETGAPLTLEVTDGAPAPAPVWESFVRHPRVVVPPGKLLPRLTSSMTVRSALYVSMPRVCDQTEHCVGWTLNWVFETSRDGRTVER